MIARAGEPVSLPCAYHGRPPIKHAHWALNGELLELPTFVELRFSNGEVLNKYITLLSNFSLYISYAEEIDSGIYTCMMGNGFGNASVSVTLTVSAGLYSVAQTNNNNNNNNTSIIVIMCFLFFFSKYNSTN